jgi:hypothetical protein
MYGNTAGRRPVFSCTIDATCMLVLMLRTVSAADKSYTLGNSASSSVHSHICPSS